VSDLVLDASLALQWFLEDEADRKYSLASLRVFPKSVLWSLSCGSMKLAMASSWRIDARESLSTKSTVSSRA
jgi:hypothetical protein